MIFGAGIILAIVGLLISNSILSFFRISNFCVMLYWWANEAPGII